MGAALPDVCGCQSAPPERLAPGLHPAKGSRAERRRARAAGCRLVSVEYGRGGRDEALR